MTKKTESSEFIRAGQMAKEMVISENIRREQQQIQESMRLAKIQFENTIRIRQQTKKLIEQRRKNALKAKQKQVDRPKMLKDMRHHREDRFSLNIEREKSIEYAIMAKGQNVKKRERFNSDISHMKTLMTQSYAPAAQSRLNQNGFSKEAIKAFEEIKKVDLKKQKQAVKAQAQPKKKEKLQER